VSEAPDGDRSELSDSVHRSLDRRERSKREARSLGQDLALMGALGWLIVVPVLLGVALGRALDRAQHSGITWTAACILLGSVLGGSFAWKRMHQP